MRAKAIKKINKWLTLLTETQTEQVMSYVFYLIDSEEFTKEEVFSILEAKKESRNDIGTDWRKIQRTNV